VRRGVLTGGRGEGLGIVVRRKNWVSVGYLVEDSFGGIDNRAPEYHVPAQERPLVIWRVLVGHPERPVADNLFAPVMQTLNAC
jgi:hypothetical protein